MGALVGYYEQAGRTADAAKLREEREALKRGPSAERGTASAGRTFDRAVASAALDRLTPALDNYDVTSANGALADLNTSGLSAWADDDLGRLRRCVDGYEYDEARGIASRLLSRVHGGEA